MLTDTSNVGFPLSSHCFVLVLSFPECSDSALLLAGMDVVKVGGPVYRIGVGGGAASSVQVSGNSPDANSMISRGPMHG